MIPSAVSDRQGGVALLGPVDKLDLYAPLSTRADQIDEDPVQRVPAGDAAFAGMGVKR